MMITERSKRVILLRPKDAKRVGDGCFYLDLIVWLNGDRIELGERVGFNYGCYVNGYGGLRVGDGCVVGGGSVVAGELEPYCIAVGNPARAIKRR
jgi:acetyltransferase-like isoleucine patch superfamily enzyme